MVARLDHNFLRLLCIGLLLFPVSELCAQPVEKGAGVKLINKLPSAEKPWALIIGIDSYQDANVTPLHGAANDAKRLAKALENYAGFKPEQIILLTTDAPKERQPSRRHMLLKLSNLKSLIPPDGLLLFSFSGHGVSQGGSAFLLPYDASITDDIETLKDMAIGVERVRSAIENIKVRQVLMLLDACRNDPFAGKGDTPNALTPAYEKGFSFDVANNEVEAFATLYATSKGDRAYEYTEKQQGYFSWAVVDGLSGKAADENGRVTLGSLVKYIEQIVPLQVKIDLGNRRQFPYADIGGYKANELVLSVTSRKQPLSEPPPPSG